MNEFPISPYLLYGDMKTLYDENLVGKKFHSLTCKSVQPRDAHGVLWCEWDCDCGKTLKARAADVALGKKKSCNCRRYRIGATNPNWGGHGGVSGNYWYQVCSGAKSRNLPLEITIADVWTLFQSQNGKCALTGVSLVLPTKCKDKVATASLDRKDSSKGYVKGNVQWIHKTLNMMKMDLPENIFVEWCKKVAECH